jgi:L-iditol 2-dehydrogenase
VKRLIIESSSHLQWIEQPCLKVLPHTVKVQVSACGVCGSDVAFWKGHRLDPYFGHEFTGIVMEVGSDVPDLKPGMRVASGLIKTCGRCWHCRNGHPNYCRGQQEPLVPGGFAEETLVEHSERFQFLSPLPSAIDDVTGTLHEPVSCTLRIVDRANIAPGQSVVVIGLGAIGALSAELLKALGAGIVIGLDLNPNRVATAQRLRMDRVINRLDEDWLEQVRKETGSHGADVVIEATGSPKALGDAFLAARLGGKIIVGSVYHDLANNLDVLPILRKELTIIGAKGSYPYLTSSDKSTAMQTILANHFSVKELIGVYSPDKATHAFEAATSGRYVKPVIKMMST